MIDAWYAFWRMWLKVVIWLTVAGLGLAFIVELVRHANIG
jgi:hypothetical protein